MRTTTYTANLPFLTTYLLNLRYKDVCKRSKHITADSCEKVAVDRVIWRMSVAVGVSKSEEQKCGKRETRNSVQQLQRPPSIRKSFLYIYTRYTCNICFRNCHYRVELFSHDRNYAVTGDKVVVCPLTQCGYTRVFWDSQMPERLPLQFHADIIIVLVLLYIACLFDINFPDDILFAE